MSPLLRRSSGRGLTLALQGGGAHGAFTWGVLDRLLELGRFDLRAITGTSAGAVNAVALASGLASGGVDGARQCLADVWGAVGSSPSVGYFVTGPSDSPSLTPSARTVLRLSKSLSPGQLNPLGTDPLADTLRKFVDFELLQTDRAPRIALAATGARTGRLRLFGNAELTVDTVIASACLPAIHKAVLVDGEPYWDGGYTANPPLLPALDFAPSDVLMVLICPTTHESTPTTSSQIKARESEFAFTASFLREAELLAAATARAADSTWLTRGHLERRLLRIRWHVLDAGPVLARLSPESRVIAHRPFLESLREKGRAAVANG